MTRLLSRTTFSLVLFYGLAAGRSGAEVKAPPGPLTPAEERASFELEPGLAVELAAAEPLVASPCAVAWDERGRMFVAENRGYPTGGPGAEPAGRIALLTDTDGDGLPDRRSDFAAGLTFPNGLLPWRGGVIVTCAPDVLFLKDTDGDGQADVREVLLTGFATTGSTQLRVNDPTLGPDGWVYLVGGLSGGAVYSPKHPDRKLDLARNDVKFRPDSGEIEPVDGKGQFGLTFDDAGHRFVCNNRVQVQHAPLSARYLARNPGVAVPGVLHNCPDLVANILLGSSTDAGARVYPISSNVTTADSHAGTYSAACGVHIARGDALPAEYVGRAWSCDPTANLVRYDELIPVGGTFHARRVRENTEALRSRDDWFRPVFLADGPDGALYVCDMYRRTIEHPDYLPEEVRKHTDFDAGKDMGRIWRVAGADATKDRLAEATKRSLPLFQEPSEKNLLTALRSGNGWARDTAFRLITERGDKAMAAALGREVAAADSPAATVVACLNLLANLDTLSDDTLTAALKHPAAPVRENAVRLAEARLPRSPALAELVLSLADDDDEHVHVRYAAALAAGEIGRGPGGETERVIDVLARAAVRDAGDRWFRAAILTAVPTPDAQRQLLTRLSKAPDASEGVFTLLRDLAGLSVAGAEGQDLAKHLNRLAEDTAAAGFDTRAALLAGFGERGAAEVRRRLKAARADDAVVRTVAEAVTVAGDPAAPVARRLRAVALLSIADDPDSAAALLALAAPEQPGELAVAAVRALAQPHRAAAVPALLSADRWRRYSPVLRGTVITSLAGRPEFAPALVDALEAGTVPAGALSAGQRDWLARAGDDQLKARAATLLAAGTAAGRKEAFERARAVLDLKPVAANGRRVFMSHCASCHRLEREGVAVGPDLFGIRNQPKESILLHIVLPEQEVAPNFTAYDCVTTDGRTITGIMTAESPSAVTLRQVLGLEETIRRDQIKSLAVSRFSLMPQGLEKAMKAQELADLLAYLRGER